MHVTDTEMLWASLMRAANGGDRVAYGSFLKSITPHLTSFVRSGLARAGVGNADHEDVVQEILIALHQKRHTWREEEPIRPWIFAISRYKLIDALRRRWRRAEVDISDFAETLAAEEGDAGLTPAEIEKALASLPENQRRIVSAISVEGRSIREVSEDHAMKEGTVRVALHRGLKSLAARFGKDMP